jgi:DNA mismatch repair protein MutS
LDEVITCRSLFATHYHELTEFAEASATAENHCVSARQQDGEVVFLHRVTQGAASRSYGVAVAQLAGLPEAVLARARALLESLEAGKGAAPGAGGRADTSQMDLFRANESDAAGEEVISTLRGLDPDRMTGIEALQLLHQLSRRLEKSPRGKS